MKEQELDGDSQPGSSDDQTPPPGALWEGVWQEYQVTQFFLDLFAWTHRPLTQEAKEITNKKYLASFLGLDSLIVRPDPSSSLTCSVLSTNDSEYKCLTGLTPEWQLAMASESKVSTPWAEREEGLENQESCGGYFSRVASFQQAGAI